jgi:predicted acyltransferase
MTSSSKKTIAGLLNILVLPGLGTFILQRHWQAATQTLISILGVILLLGSSLYIAAEFATLLEENPELAQAADKETLSPAEENAIKESLKKAMQEKLTLTPFMLALAGIGLLLAGWVWGIVTLFLPIPSKNPES